MPEAIAAFSRRRPTHNNPRVSWAVAVGLIAQSTTAVAQVSIEAFRDRIPEAGVAASVDGRLTGDSGNTRGISAGAAAFFGARRDPHLGFLAASGNYNRFSHETEAENYFAHLRYNYQLWARVWLEGFTQVEHDRFKRLRLRRLVGAGPRFRILDSEPVRAYFGTAYMLELESLDATEDSPASDSLAHRWSNYLSAVYKADERITLSVMTLFQPRFDKLSDFRVLVLSAAEFAVGNRLAAGLQFNYQYDSAPPSDVRPEDISVVNTLGLRY